MKEDCKHPHASVDTGREPKTPTAPVGAALGPPSDASLVTFGVWSRRLRRTKCAPRAVLPNGAPQSVAPQRRGATTRGFGLPTPPPPLALWMTREPVVIPGRGSILQVAIEEDQSPSPVRAQLKSGTSSRCTAGGGTTGGS